MIYLVFLVLGLTFIQLNFIAAALGTLGILWIGPTIQYRLVHRRWPPDPKDTEILFLQDTVKAISKDSEAKTQKYEDLINKLLSGVTNE